MQELTKRAVLMLLPLEVSFDTVVAGALLAEGLVEVMVVPPRRRKRASQRMVRCWARVVRKQRRR